MLYLVVDVYECVFVCVLCGRYGILFVVICVFLGSSDTSGGIVGMVGDRYCMWVEYRVVWYVRMIALCPLPLSF